MKEQKSPRGLRNNNPGNIRITKDQWEGLCKEQTDPSFFQFIAPEWGYRALIRTLQNYYRLHDCRTIADYINRWAPPIENDTSAYIESVCNQLKQPLNYTLDIYNKNEMCALAAAISYHENGVPAVMADIHKGWELL